MPKGNPNDLGYCECGSKATRKKDSLPCCDSCAAIEDRWRAREAKRRPERESMQVLKDMVNRGSRICCEHHGQDFVRMGKWDNFSFFKKND